MPECTNCSSFIPPNETKCPVCGKDITDDIILDPELAEINDKVHSHLINANLKKLRGDFEGAIQECISALRVNPDNVEAHSLLGDIYREQGNLSEAERWYQIALDLNPESVSVRTRLEQLGALLNKTEKKREESAGERRASTNWIYAAGLAIVILLVLISLIYPLLYNVTNKEAEEPQIPSIKGAANKIRPSQNSTAHPSTVPLVTSEQEATLIRNLNSSTSLTEAKLQVVGLMIDPRDNSASITYINHTGANDAQSYAKSAFTVAYEAFRHDPTLTEITIRALYSVPVNGRLSAQVVFEADLKRDKLMQIDPTTSDINQIMGALENVWYYPGLIPGMAQPLGRAAQMYQ